MGSVKKAVSWVKADGTKLSVSKKLVERSVQSSQIVPVAVNRALPAPTTTSNVRCPHITMLNGDTMEGLGHILSSNCISSNEPAVLVFASDTNPGGSSRSANQGTQEEAICRASTLRLALETLDYPIPREGIAYVPHVQAFIEIPDRESAPTFTALCGALRECVAGTSPSAKETAYLDLKICGILDQAVFHGHRDLVLGAWGCGAFFNPVDWVAQGFCRCIQLERYCGKFDSIVFAIPNFKMFCVFEDCFAGLSCSEQDQEATRCGDTRTQVKHKKGNRKAKKSHQQIV